MGSAKVNLREIDISTRVPSFPGVYGAILIPDAKKGMTEEAYLCTSDTELLKQYTPNETIEVGWDMSYFSSLAYLKKSDKLWILRIANGALFGGFRAMEMDNPNVAWTSGQSNPESSYTFDTNELFTLFSANPGVWGNDISIKMYKYYASENFTVNVSTNELAVTQDWTTSIDVAVSTDGILPAPLTAGDIYYVLRQSATSIKLSPVSQRPEDFTADFNSDELTLGQKWATGTAVELTTTGTLPAGLATGTTYYVIYVSYSNDTEIGKIRLATTEADAVANDYIDITDNGTGVHTITPKEVDLLDTETFTGTAVNDLLTVAEYWPTGVKVQVTDTGSGLPGGLSEGIDYYTIHISETTIQLAASYEDSQVGLAIDLTADGDGSIVPRASSGAFTIRPAQERVKEPESFLIEVYKTYKSATSMEESFICSRIEGKKDGHGRNIFIEDVLEGSNYIRGMSNPDIDPDTSDPTTLYPQEQLTRLSFAEGEDSDPVTDGHMIQGLSKIANPDDVPITLLLDGGRATAPYQQALVSLAEERQDCVAILSTPYDREASSNYLNEIIDYRRTVLNVSSSYASLYCPHVKIYDKFNDRYLYVPPDGYAAGVISDTAANYEMWYPPAGFRRGIIEVLDLRRRFSSAEMDYLYDNGINPLRFAPGRGILVWGQKTLLSRPSSLDRLNVRLLLLVIEPAIKVALEDFEFEINDATTRAIVKSIIDSYMDDIQARRGVYEYMTICDDTNNTPEDIDNHRLNVWLFIKPVQSIEYINFTVVITRTGTEFSLAAASL